VSRVVVVVDVLRVRRPAVVECAFRVGDDRGDLGTPTKEARVLLDSEQAARLRDRGEDRRRVERHQRAEVDDLGVDAVLGSPDGLKKFVSIKESPYHGLNFCQGTVSEQLERPGEQIFDVIRYFGSRKKIFSSRPVASPPRSGTSRSRGSP